MPTGKAVVRLRDLAQRMFVSDPTQLFRRYFINTLFDSTFVVLGILAATALSAEADVDLALGALFAASLAMGISTGVSVYEAEHTEGELRMRRLERAMLSPLKDTDVGREIRFARYAVSLVNFLAPSSSRRSRRRRSSSSVRACCLTSPRPPASRGPWGSGSSSARDTSSGASRGGTLGRRRSVCRRSPS